MVWPGKLGIEVPPTDTLSESSKEDGTMQFHSRGPEDACYFAGLHWKVIRRNGGWSRVFCNCECEPQDIRYTMTIREMKYLIK